MNYTQHSLDLMFGTIPFAQYGRDDGRPVVFVHGFLVDESVWSDVPERLAREGYRVITPTWPLGAHRTPMNPEADLSPKGLAHLVLAFLEQLDLRNVLLVGNDTGGAVCQFVLDIEPSRIGGVVLSNCDAFTTFPPAQFKAVFRAGKHPGLSAWILKAMRWRVLRHSRLGIGLLANQLDPAETLRWFTPSIEDGRIRQDIARFLRGVRPEELNEVSTRLDQFRRPVSVVWGEDDRAFTPELGQRLAQAFRDARFVAIPDARTFVSLDAPERFATEISSVGARTV